MPPAVQLMVLITCSWGTEWEESGKLHSLLKAPAAPPSGVGKEMAQGRGITGWTCSPVPPAAHLAQGALGLGLLFCPLCPHGLRFCLLFPQPRFQLHFLPLQALQSLIQFLLVAGALSLLVVRRKHR